MRVLVDALSVSPGGGATVASGLLWELSNLDKEDQYTLLVKNSLLQGVREWPSNVRFVSVGRVAGSPAIRTAWEQLCVPRRMRSGHHDVFFGLGGFGLLRGNWPQVIIIQNALFYVANLRRTLRNRVRLPIQRDLQLAALNRGATGVCVSRAVQQQLREYAGDQARLVVVLNGVEQVAANLDVSRYKSSTKAVILWVGSAAPYKNPAELVEAVSVVEKGAPGHIEVRFAGAIPDNEQLALTQQANRLGSTSSLTFLGFLSQQQLQQEYRSATVFVSTSRVEASPLPPLEAIANGAPTILTSIAPHLEIVPDGPSYSAGTPSELARELRRLLDDPSVRRRVAEDGLASVRRRTWRAAAEAYRQELKRASGTG